MTEFGYHVSHEQYAPSTLLSYVCRAEAAGFRGALSSDHFHPWLDENGQSGFAWSWLGAALQATKPTTTFGTVNAPGHRYHPAVIAQAAATLAEMYPARFWLAVGTGEAVNERITGSAWPPKPERQQRLRECVDVMRRLWRGETVTHRGRVVVDGARLYSLPERPPPLFGAAVSETTARWLGEWADGLITTGRSRDEMQRMIDAFHDGGGARKPVYVQHVLSWAPTEHAACAAAHAQWRFAVLDAEQLWNLDSPAAFADATASVSDDELRAKIRISSDLGRHAAWLHEYRELGVSRVFCLNVGGNQEEFIDAFGAHVLPELASHGRPRSA
jgi:probable non-F420 flavinoid oxidoreductase